jgi:hypothetical protein
VDNSKELKMQVHFTKINKVKDLELMVLKKLQAKEKEMKKEQQKKEFFQLVKFYKINSTIEKLTR